MIRKSYIEMIRALLLEADTRFTENPEAKELADDILDAMTIDDVEVGAIRTFHVHFDEKRYPLNLYRKVAHQAIGMFNHSHVGELETIAGSINCNDASEEEILDRLKQVTGAAPSIEEGASPEENLAWAVCAWIYFHRDAAHYAGGDEIDQRAAEWLLRSVGRVEEWWRWRRLGLDADAKAKRKERERARVNGAKAGPKAQREAAQRRAEWFAHLDALSRSRRWLLMGEAAQRAEAVRRFKATFEKQPDRADLFKSRAKDWYTRELEAWREQAREQAIEDEGEPEK